MNGQPVHGLLHPEAGHLCLKRMPGDAFEGVDALFGGASVEGLSSTPALAARKAREEIMQKRKEYTRFLFLFLFLQQCFGSFD